MLGRCVEAYMGNLSRLHRHIHKYLANYNDYSFQHMASPCPMGLNLMKEKKNMKELVTVSAALPCAVLNRNGLQNFCVPFWNPGSCVSVYAQ